jgi:nicotinate-nucleotide pyrophosphorylase (carboxylating)
MPREFPQITWDSRLDADCRALIGLALAEDLGVEGDWTSKALMPEDAERRAAVAAREETVVAGLPAVGLTLAAVDPRLKWRPEVQDGAVLGPGARAGVIEGPAQGILAAERILLNFISRLSGIADLTRQYVAAVAGTAARIYDTRKTAPGWRRLEKYAVRCGGGWNHRAGLSEAVLIKDNHLAWGGVKDGGQDGNQTGRVESRKSKVEIKTPTLDSRLSTFDKQQMHSKQAENSAEDSNSLPKGEGRIFTPAEAVRRARDYLRRHAGERSAEMIVEIEVDTLDQLAAVLPAGPDLVLLDNMTPEELRRAVALRNRLNSGVELEASGGVDLSRVREVAETGVERISVGALTHSAPARDFGLDGM